MLVQSKKCDPKLTLLWKFELANLPIIQRLTPKLEDELDKEHGFWFGSFVLFSFVFNSVCPP